MLARVFVVIAFLACNSDAASLQPSSSRQNRQDLEVITLDSQGDPANSVLIQALRGANGKKQMPVGAAPLAEDDIKKVETWIKDGAKG